VFPEEVAVAVMKYPGGTVPPKLTLKFAFPVAFVTVAREPRNKAPPPFPDTSQMGFAKNSSVRVAFVALSKVPWIVVTPPQLEAGWWDAPDRESLRRIRNPYRFPPLRGPPSKPHLGKGTSR
jgi:hypothetical protein